MKPGARCHIQHPFGAALFQRPNKKISLALGAAFPIDEFIPFFDKIPHVLVLVVIRLPHSNGIFSKILNCATRFF